MAHKTDRRTFLQATTAATVGYWVAGGVQAAESKSAIERIRFGCVGIGGKGSSDSEDASKHGDIVAICDIDDQRLDACTKRKGFEKATKYNDFRKLLDEMEGKIDAVTVSTPDHTHAPAAAMAMRKKMHCFCQKPLTHSIHEARVLGQLARNKLATQMGNQGTAMPGLRKAAATIRAGAIGPVSEVHVWTNRPIWPQGGDRPKETPAPAHIHWEDWLAGAPYRPYGVGYHPFSWRGYWDFGTGALGDMACHTSNMAFMALDLKDPISVAAETSGHNQDSYPKWSIITYEFAANDTRPALKMVWYDGGKRPDKEILDGENPSGSGSIIIGEKGKLYSPNDYGAEYKLLGKDLTQPDVKFPESPGHFQEWTNAIKGEGTPMSNFADYAGPLTETVLLGNLAVWASGKKIEWDAKNLKATNAPDLDGIIKHTYREGYSV